MTPDAFGAWAERNAVLILAIGGDDASDLLIFMHRFLPRADNPIVKLNLRWMRGAENSRLQYAKWNYGLRDLLFSEVRSCELDRARLVMA